MLLNMTDSRIGPLPVLYYTKKHSALRDGAWSVNKARRNSLPTKGLLSLKKEQCLGRNKVASSI